MSDSKQRRERKKLIVIITILSILMLFLIWRFLRPMQIFVVSPAFERPIDTSQSPAMFNTLSAQECAVCHREFYDEWSTTIHSQAWTDPYFLVDWKFDGSMQICKNCHIPLDRQQEHRVLGFNDAEKFDPLLEPNTEFDPVLQHEGVTCNACHLRNGKILGVLGDTAAPHPVEKIDNGNQMCVRCHLVSGDRWDTFYKFPPCGTVAEIESTRGKTYMSIEEEIATIGCVDCHMPLLERAIVSGGSPRSTRRHLWRGGHDPQMVRKALSISFKETTGKSADKRRFTLSISNTGASHYVPTGTPDRHLTVQIRILNGQGKVIKEKHFILKRTVMWRPFIVDLWDTRLSRGETREYDIEVAMDKTAIAVEAEVQYHLLEEARRRHIGYENKEPIYYTVYQQQLPII